MAGDIDTVETHVPSAGNRHREVSVTGAHSKPWTGCSTGRPSREAILPKGRSSQRQHKGKNPGSCFHLFDSLVICTGKQSISKAVLPYEVGLCCASLITRFLLTFRPFGVLYLGHLQQSRPLSQSGSEPSPGRTESQNSGLRVHENAKACCKSSPPKALFESGTRSTSLSRAHVAGRLPRLERW